jgi:hypothetical protein
MSTAANRLLVSLEGAPEDGTSVRLGDLQQFLQDLNRTLRSLEAEISGAPTLVYRVVGLKTGSAQFEIDIADEAHPQGAAGRLLAQRFIRTVDLVARGLEPEGTTYDTLSNLKNLAVRPGRHIRGIRLGGAGERDLRVPSDFGERIDRMLRQTHHSYTTQRGRLDQVNVHGPQPRFYIYPAAGPTRIACAGARTLLPELGAYLGQLVEVEGRARYHGERFPHLIEVASIRRLHQDLPTADAVIGSIPDLTGELSTNAYLEALRAG